MQPRGGGGNRAHVTARRVPKGRGLPRGCGASRRRARARARTRPHVSLRPRGMWVTEPSGLTCPRPPPPPQCPLCNAASRARPANRRPCAAERKHSAHVARAARPCEGGAGPAPPGRAAALRGSGRATRGATGAEPVAHRKSAAAHPVRPRDNPRPPPPEVPQRAPSALSAVPDPPQSGSYLHSPPWCPRGEEGGRGRPLPAERAAPPPPQRCAAPDWRQRGSRGPLMGRAGGAPGTRGRRAGCSKRQRQPASGAPRGVPDNKSGGAAASCSQRTAAEKAADGEGSRDHVTRAHTPLPPPAPLPAAAATPPPARSLVSLPLPAPRPFLSSASRFIPSSPFPYLETSSTHIFPVPGPLSPADLPASDWEHPPRPPRQACSPAPSDTSSHL